MLLRRMISHVRRQDWLAVFLDFVIVVVGVFIGIQVSNWNAARQERVAGDAYLMRIADDITRDITSLENNLANLQRETEHADLIDRYLRGEDVEASDWDMFQIIYYRAGWTPFTPNRVTYDELISAGRYNLIEEDMRRRLGDYYAGLEDFAIFYEFQPPLRELIRGKYPPKAQEYMWHSCFTDVHYRSGAGGFTECEPLAEEAIVSETLAALRQAEGLLDAVRYVHSIRLVVMGGAETDLQEARSVLTELEDNLK